MTRGVPARWSRPRDRIRVPRGRRSQGFRLHHQALHRPGAAVAGGDPSPMSRPLAAGLCEPAVGAHDDRLRDPRRGRRAVFPARGRSCGAFALLIAFSRIAVSAHFVSDVLAGAAVGGLGAWCVRDWFALRRLGFVVTRDGEVKGPFGPVAGPDQKGCPDADRPIKGRGAMPDRPMTDAECTRVRRRAARFDRRARAQRSRKHRAADRRDRAAPWRRSRRSRSSMSMTDRPTRPRRSCAASPPSIRPAPSSAMRMSCGQSAAVRTGVRRRARAVVATLDGDGQNDPAVPPRPVAALEARPDRRPRRRPARRAQGDRLQEAAVAHRQCGARRGASRRHARYRLRPQGVPRAMSFWRCPISTGCTAFCRRWCGAKAIASPMSTWSTARACTGVSNYGFCDRLWVGILDLVGVWWLIRRKKRVPQVSEVLRDAD